MTILDQIARRRVWAEDERLVLDQVQRVADDIIAPNAERYDRSGEFPWDSVNALNELGLNAIFVPEAYGGAPMRYSLYLECVSIISEACA
ncbi:MAG: acyl-CoA dehydrogenase family protein, partial [Alphaproteobacteria bacterium]